MGADVLGSGVAVVGGADRNSSMEETNAVRWQRQVEYNGETLTIEAWAQRLGVTPTALARRLTAMALSRALTMPKQRKGYAVRLGISPTTVPTTAIEQGILGCGCKECQVRRYQSTPRTLEERMARAKRERDARARERTAW